MSQTKIYLKEHCEECDIPVEKIDSINEDGDNGIITTFTCPKCKTQWCRFYEFQSSEKLSET